MARDVATLGRELNRKPTMHASLPYLLVTGLALSASGCTTSLPCASQPVANPPALRVIRHGRYTLEDVRAQTTVQDQPYRFNGPCGEPHDSFIATRGAEAARA